jgi:hypothetical protein
VKHESLEQTARYWVGQDKQERYMWKRTGKKLSLTQERGPEGRIREVLQEDSRSSMYKVYDCMIVSGKLLGVVCSISPMLDYVARDYSCLYFRIFTILIGVHFSAG